MAGLARHWKLSSAVAVASYLTITAMLIVWPDFSFPAHGITIVFRLAREIEAWVAIAALIGIAERFWNRDTSWRGTLAEATFPFYIIHQTIIVIVEFWLKPLSIGPLAEFAILVPTTVAGCWAFYLIGRELNPIRPLIGLKKRIRPPIRSTPIAEPTWTRHDRAQSDVA
jgi:hypothetical protein